MSVALEASRSAALWHQFAEQASEVFSTRFEFQPLGPDARGPQLEFYSGDGVAVSKGVMPALRITNHGSSWPDPYFQIAVANQASVFDIAGRGTLRPSS